MDFYACFCLDLASSAKKDIGNILGVRENELTGYGLVIGLNSTGDKNNSNMLETMNVSQTTSSPKM